MEWDFLGLSSKNIAEDAASSSKDTAVRGSRMQWPFSNIVSGAPQLMSFKAPQEDRTRKTMVDHPVTSQGYMNVSTPDAVDSNNNRPFLGVMQKNMIVAKQGGNRHGTTVYPMQHLGGHSAFPQEASSMFGVSKQSNQMSRQVLQSSNLVSSDHHMLNSAIKPQLVGGLPPITQQSNQMTRKVLQSSDLVSSEHHMLNAAIKPQLVGGLPPITQQSNQMSRQVLQSSDLVSSEHHMLNSAIKPQHLGGLPPINPAPVLPFRGSGSNVGTTDLRNSSKSSGTVAPAQLTIFFAGSVRVYNDITPEKAQDIMLLAGKGSNSSENKTVSSSQVHAPISVPSKDDAFIMSQSYPTSLPSPLRERGSSTNNELNMMTPTASSVARSNLLESPPTSVDSAVKHVVPQARRKSLVRFLEKRKDRLLSASPYYTNMRPRSDSDSFYLNPSGYFPLRAID